MESKSTLEVLEVIDSPHPPDHDDDGSDGDELLNTHQAAALCKRSEDRMRALAADGRVPATMRRHAWWFSKRELEDILAKHPEIIYARRTPQVAVTVAMRETSRATMLRINAMRSDQERHENAKRGYAGLLKKFEREIDPEGTMDPDERERRVMMMYRAHMADVRSKRASARKLTTVEQRIAALEQRVEHEEAELRARSEAKRQHARTTSTATAESLAICFDCWRERYGGRVPAGLVNKLCPEHQRDFDAFAAELRAAS